MNILVTGGAGYIGSHVVLALKEKGVKVTVIDDLSTGNINLIPKEVNFLNCNINDNDKVDKLLKSESFNAVMHFAANIKVEESVKNPKKYFINNTDNAIIFFETCYKNNLTNIIFSSTAAVYGNSKTNNLITENNDLKPLNPYGESKKRTEKYLQDNTNRFKFIILRYFNVAGADPGLRTGLVTKQASHLIKIVSEVASKKRDKVVIFGNNYNTPDGTAIRDYIHVSDLSDIHLRSLDYLLKTKESNVFNCGYGKGYSVKEVIDAANMITSNVIKYEYGKSRKGDSETLVADVSKLKKYIDWTPSYNNLNIIIKTAIAWETQLNEKNL
tara:strand:- start:1844 stop:2827 length:984 start_codon:yes stop_codon:yes gene_type:complete